MCLSLNIIVMSYIYNWNQIVEEEVIDQKEDRLDEEYGKAFWSKQWWWMELLWYRRE